MTNNLFLNFSEIDEILEAALNNAYSYLRSFRNDAGYTQKLETAFGTGFDRAVANQLFDDFAQGNFSDIPSIEIVNRNDINNANGAFSITTGKIYLAAEFISQNAQNTDAITAVLLEEIGHSIDAQINVVDAAGDEGDAFARLVQGESISEQGLAVLRGEDDTATVTLNGQVIEIEQNFVQQVIGIGQNSFKKDDKGTNNSFTLTIENYKPDAVLEGGLTEAQKQQQTFVIIHGWNSNPSQAFGDTPDLLSQQYPNSNVIIVNWSKLANKTYTAVYPYLDLTAVTLKNTIKAAGIDPSKTTLIGYSLGAHIAGFIGQEFKKDNSLISQIIGLDPAGVLFETASANNRISPDDAQRVVVIHSSNSLTGSGSNGKWGLGLYRDDLGHLDIYIKKDNQLYGANVASPNEHDLAVDVYKDLLKAHLYGGSNQWGSDLNFNDTFDLSKLSNTNLTGNYTINLDTRFISDSKNQNFLNNGVNNNDFYIFDTDSQLGSDIINETTIALKTFHNGYVSARNGWEGWNINGWPSTIREWEQFSVINTGDGKIALKTFHNGYVSARNGWESWNINGSASKIDAWEKFTVTNNNDGTIAQDLRNWHRRSLKYSAVVL